MLASSFFEVMSLKIPISKRLLACAAFVHPDARVADIGTDHGYLGIYLLRQGTASYVAASDLREKPLQKAQENAVRFGTADQMAFYCSDGLQAIDPETVDTIVCAGMGGDCIRLILEAAPWLRDEAYRLILQPQSSGQDLRGWLAKTGFSILRETLVEDGGFLYTVLEAQYSGERYELTPGQQYVTPQLQKSGSQLLAQYRERLISSMEKTITGLKKGGGNAEKLAYYCCAKDEIERMNAQDENRL